MRQGGRGRSAARQYAGRAASNICTLSCETSDMAWSVRTPLDREAFWAAQQHAETDPAPGNSDGAGLLHARSLCIEQLRWIVLLTARVGHHSGYPLILGFGVSAHIIINTTCWPAEYANAIEYTNKSTSASATDMRSCSLCRRSFQE